MGLGIAWHDLVKFQNFHPWQFKSVTTPCLLTDDVLFRLEHENNISLQSELQGVFSSDFVDSKELYELLLKSVGELTSKIPRASIFLSEYVLEKTDKLNLFKY